MGNSKKGRSPYEEADEERCLKAGGIPQGVDSNYSKERENMDISQKEGADSGAGSLWTASRNDKAIQKFNKK